MQTVLILGASGRFGRNAAEAFWNAGWHVRLFDRASDDLIESAQGADVIVNAWNPAYPDWKSTLPNLTGKVIAAAQNSGATVIIPGNVYVYGSGDDSRFAQDTPHAATNPLGKLRIEMEQSYRDAGIPTIILRSGNFLDTEESGNWFDMMIAPPLKKGVLRYPGATNVPHAWAFLPDLARAAVALAEVRHDLPRFADVPYTGYTLTGEQLAALCALAMRQEVKITTMSWWPLYLARPFWRLAAPLLEMRYLWNKAHWLDGASFQRLIPNFFETPVQDAVEQAIAPVLRGTPDQPKPNREGPPPLPAE
ncbi:Rossmann-fold NAD(P)-binding domain-containing protein [Thalassococcus lentus]|uniref:Epimerase n=1 Tax=Thalassococcus lentus TaxID=1210524 RepID=A0ABT4XNM6_9RHOB|nr:epimerase [Thalassococcus lentus]MDA7423548.1 epimerase [Thalassococcus lentus]